MPVEETPQDSSNGAAMPTSSEREEAGPSVRCLDFSALFRPGPSLMALAFVNLIFVLWLVLYGRPSVESRGPALLAFHASIVLIVKVFPGVTTALLARRRYQDSVHFGSYVVMLAAISVLIVKQVVNLLPIPMGVAAFAAGLCVYTNASFLLARYYWTRRDRKGWEDSPPGEAPERPGPPRRSRITDLAAFGVLVALFVYMDYRASGISQIPDLDLGGFSTYPIMHWTVTGSGYYEESGGGRDAYANYTPLLQHDFSHPPLAYFDMAYAATLGGFLEYSKKFWRPIEASYSGDLYDYLDLNPSRLYIGVNRTMALYHCVLVAAVLYLFSFRLTHNSWLSLAVMLGAIGLFSRIHMFALGCIHIHKAPFMLYSLLALYCYLYMESDRWLAFAVSLVGSLVNQKFLYAVLAIVTVEVFRRRLRVLWNPFGIGFAIGTVAFIVYGLYINSQIFISSYFIRHLHDRLWASEDPFERILWAWNLFFKEFVPLWPTVLFAALAGLFAIKNCGSKRGVLFLYFLWAFFIGIKQRHCNPRYLIPALVSTIPMAAWSIQYLLALARRVILGRREESDSPTGQDARAHSPVS